jgi:hypothetical protein
MSGGTNHMPAVYIIAATQQFVRLNCGESTGNSKFDLVYTVLQGKHFKSPLLTS